jgi:hypothetical protein
MSSVFSFENWDQLLETDAPSLQPSAPTLPQPSSTTLHPGSSSRSLSGHPGSSSLSLLDVTSTTPSSSGGEYQPFTLVLRFFHYLVVNSQTSVGE